MSSSTINYKGAEIDCVGFTQWCIETESSALDDYAKHVHDVMDWVVRNPNKTYKQYLMQKKQAQGDEQKQIAGASSNKEKKFSFFYGNATAVLSTISEEDEKWLAYQSQRRFRWMTYRLSTITQ